MDAKTSPSPRGTLSLGISPAQQMVSSCSGAFITSLFVTPLDVVKIRLQSQKSAMRSGQCFLYCNGLMDHVCACLNGNAVKPWYKMPVPGHFTGTVDAFIKIARHEGVGSLWSGLPPTLVMAVPATVIYFTVYDQLKYQFGYQEQRGSLSIPMAAGALARVVAATIISPLELVRTKMQSQQLSYKQIGTAVRSSVQQEGVLSLMKGLGPTLLRDVPFSVLYWGGYEYMKAVQMRHSGSKQPTFVEAFTSGALAGTGAALVTLPFDVVKTHRQIELGEEQVFKKKASKSTWQIIKKIHKQHGITGLFAGAVPRVVKVAPACAIMISTYEYSKAFFRTRNSERYDLMKST